MCNLLRFILYVRANPKYKSPGLIFGGAYIRRVFYVSNLGAYIRMGLYLKGLIFGGAYFRNFTVWYQKKKVPEVGFKSLTSISLRKYLTTASHTLS